MSRTKLLLKVFATCLMTTSILASCGKETEPPVVAIPDDRPQIPDDRPQLAPTYTVITPVSSLVMVVNEYTNNHSVLFNVANPTQWYHTASLSCSTQGNVTCTGVNPTTLALDPFQTDTVIATFNAGAPMLNNFLTVTDGAVNGGAGTKKIRINEIP